MTFNATKDTADFVANIEYDSKVKSPTVLYHNQEYYYNNNLTLKVFDATTNTELTPSDDYSNVMKLNNTQSWLSFNAKYATGQKFRIELVANVGGGDTPDPKNTTLIICCCVVAIILIIILTVCCIKRNSAKRLEVDEATGDQNQLV